MFYCQTGESTRGLEVEVAYLGNNDFRVEADGLSMDVSLAVYFKVNNYFLFLLEWFV